MNVENLKTGAAVDAPTVSASMATALLVYSGIAVKMLVDQRLGAVLHQMFMVEYEPGGGAQPHDHPFEEMYHVLDGEVDAVADGEEFTLRPARSSGRGSGACTRSTTTAAGACASWRRNRPCPRPTTPTDSTAIGSI